MSKGNMLLGHARGKVGSLVFSRSNGQQIVRSRAEVVKNPQTTTQMIQRIILNTVAQAYSRMAAICDHSFEGIQTGQKSMSYFMRKNMDALRAKIANISVDSGLLGDVYAYTPIGQNVLAPNAYEIAKGTLPEVRAYMLDEDNTVAAMSLNENTYAGVINQYGLQRGDQLTFVTMQQDGLTNIVSFHFARIILDPMNADNTEADINSPFIVDGSVNLPNVRNQGEFAKLVYDTDHVEFGFTNGYLSATGIIVSRKNGATWLRSNCTMVASDVSYGQAVSMGEALDMFAAGGFDSLNPQYLNNSGTGNVVTVDPSNGGSSTYKVYRNTAESGAPVYTSYEIVRTEMKNGLLVGYDAQNNLYLFSNDVTLFTSYKKLFKTFGSMTTKADIVANWAGFPADVTTTEQKQNYVDAHSASMLYPDLNNSTDAEQREYLAALQAAVDFGFSRQCIEFGTPVGTWD